MAENVITQEITDRTTEKTRATQNVIHVFTGQPPKDYQHIHDVKTYIEKFPHPNVRAAPTGSGTLPVGTGDVWNRMTDWDQLTVAEQTSVKAFLLERFSADDLELAYDEYYPKFGRLPTVHDYRVFILNWEGRRDKTRSLAQMKADLETKDINIDQLTNRETNLKLALDFAVNHSVNQGEQIDTLVRDNGNLQDEVEHKTAAINHLSTSNRQLVHENRQLNQDISAKDRVIMQKDRSYFYLKKKISEDVEKKEALCSELNTKVNNLKSNVTQLQTEKTQLQSEISQLQTENTQQQSEISQLQTENTQLQSENTQQQSEISQLQTDKKHMVAKINTMGTETRNLKRDNTMLLDSLKQQTELCNEKDIQIKKQKLKVDELQHETSEKDYRISTLESVIDTKCEEIDRLVIDNSHKDQHMKEQDNVINDLRERLQHQEAINQDLYSQIDELRQLVLRQLAAES